MCLIHDCWCKKKYKTSTLQYIRWPSKFLALGLFGERLRAKSFHHQGLVYEPPWSATSSTSPTAMTVTTTTSPRRQRRSQPVKPGKWSASWVWQGFAMQLFSSSLINYWNIFARNTKSNFGISKHLATIDGKLLVTVSEVEILVVEYFCKRLPSHWSRAGLH